MLASLPEKQRAKELARLSPETQAFLAFSWPFWARPEQLPPQGEWSNWLILAGRGWGKTRTGAEWVREEVTQRRASRIALVAETHKDLEEVMVFGDSGLANIFPKHQAPVITKKPIKIVFHTGAVALGYNATEPDQLRGPQFDLAWCDELAKWKYPRETWDMLEFGMRLGINPRKLISTTPRPIPLLKEILVDPLTMVTRGNTMDNASNLAKKFLTTIRKKYEGTRLGRQELAAEILDDLPGAMWSKETLEKYRVKRAPDMRRIVISVDPSGTKGPEGKRGDDIGIVAAGLGYDDAEGYVLEDGTCNLPPEGWARRAIELFVKYDADLIIAETNFGGAMVESTLRSVNDKIPFKQVTASRGKVARAEPVAALYEQGRVHHVGMFPELEDQMLLMAPEGYAGEGSPDRCDAAVWAITELMLNPRRGDAAFPETGHY